MTVAVRGMRLHRFDVTHRTTWLVVEVVTDQGLVGVGECSDATRLDELPLAAADAFAVLAGGDVEAGYSELDKRLWAWASEADEPGRRFMRRTLVGGITAALCDLAAQVDEVPLWKWLGGEHRPVVQLYANINRSAGRRRPDDFGELAARAALDGFGAIKLAPFDGDARPEDLVEAGVARVRAVRDAVGDDVEVMVDAHLRLSHEQLVNAVPELEAQGVSWLEDAVDVLAPRELSWLRERTSIPLAGGERLVEADDLAVALSESALSILLLDPKYVGGPLRLRRLLTDIAGVALTYHNPTGPVGTIAAAHLSTLHPEFTVMEFAYGEDVDRSAMTHPAEWVCDGEITIPDGPGLGVRLNHDAGLPSATTWEWAA